MALDINHDILRHEWVDADMSGVEPDVVFGKLDAMAKAMAEAGVIDAFDEDTFDAATFSGGVSFKIFDDYPAISMALDAGDVDAFCVDKSILANYKTDGRSFIADSFSPQEYGVATKKGSELSAKVEELITGWLADGTIDGMIAEWGLE
jgi:putative glutamine transport system substrate-binding protein